MLDIIFISKTSIGQFNYKQSLQGWIEIFKFITWSKFVTSE